MSGIINSAGSKSGVIGETEIDYEEGTWTPAIVNGSLSATNPHGLYTRVGRIVNLAWELTVPSNSDGNGFEISGCPFFAQELPSGSGYTQAINIGYSNDGEAGDIHGFFYASTNRILFLINGGNCLNSALSTKAFRGNATYSIM